MVWIPAFLFVAIDDMVDYITAGSKGKELFSNEILTETTGTNIGKKSLLFRKACSKISNRYAILKDNMCLGISFNALKEAVIERYKSEHRSDDLEYSNDNKRFFVLCNFVLWRYLCWCSERHL